MAVTQYIGSRYVPIFADPIEWSSAKEYEPLTIVIHEGNSFTSKQFVPVGIDIDNETYWAETGNYNAQVEQYRREVAAAEQVATQANTNANAAQSDIDTLLPKSNFSSTNTVKKYVDDVVADIEDYINTIFAEIKSFELFYDKFNTTINCYVTGVKMKRSDYAMNVYIPEADMYNVPYYKPIFEGYKNTIFCSPSLGAKYFVHNGQPTGFVRDNKWCLLCMDSDGNFSYVEDYGQNITADWLIERGITEAMYVWSPIKVDGVTYNFNRIPDAVESRSAIIDNSHPRFLFGWDNDYIYLIAVNGSIPFSDGATYDELVTLSNELRISNVINCDGGGSTQMWLCPFGYNMVLMRNVNTAQQHSPNNSRAKVMVGFSPKEV